MDPRHPEQAIPRMDELMAQYKETMRELANVTTNNELSRLERKGVLITQEICLVAPRLHEALMNVSREGRRNIGRTPASPRPDLTKMFPQFDSKGQVKVEEEPVIEEEPKPKKRGRKKKVEE